jgi:hypothetical protein
MIIQSIARGIATVMDVVMFPFMWVARGEGETKTLRPSGGYYGEPKAWKRLFDPNIVYPIDGVGQYIELTGRVVDVWTYEFDARVIVETDKGTFEGYTGNSFPSPKINDIVVIRVYDVGGGWYPDNKIMRWSTNEKD